MAMAARMMNWLRRASTSSRAFLHILLLACLAAVVTSAAMATAPPTNHPKLVPVANASGGWGLAVSNAGMANVVQKHPVQIELWSAMQGVTNLSAAYEDFLVSGQRFEGRTRIRVQDGSAFEVSDIWTQEGDIISPARTLRVSGSSSNGFASGFRFTFTGPRAWTNAQWFVPGTIYGGFDHLNPAAIGGREHYKPGNFTVRIREDRLPAPLVLSHFADNSSLAILNPAPKGGTSPFEGSDVRAVTLINTNFQFGALGAEEDPTGLSIGCWFPGSEGEVTYAGNTYPGGQQHAWRRRYHPVQDGWTQQFQVRFRVGNGESFPTAMADTWRWAWKTLNPQVHQHDIPAVRRALVDMLAANAIEKNGRTGIPFSISAVTGDKETADRRVLMGFCGKNLEAVNFLLQEAALGSDETRSGSLRKTAEAIAASFITLKMSPPEGEGWRIDDGAIICARLKEQAMYLRCFCDDVKMLLQAYAREKQLGRHHSEWLAWCREFADWLLPQQRPDGGFPRSWKLGSSEIASASPNSSFNTVPMLVLLTGITGERKYLDGAVRAADFCWSNGQSGARFVGGTIDNPDVLDKEAATLSLEAYWALFEATKEARWLERAKGAANYAETWIYIWNVPMPYQATAPNAQWKPGVPTIGVQLIATGHSLVDAYMAFDADDFAKLYKHSGDAHYYEVARLLLHCTKSMLAVPGRTYDLTGPGWQQEHWSMAPRRGQGLHRRWLPWVSTSHLNGIFGLMNFDPALFDRLSTANNLN